MGPYCLGILTGYLLYKRPHIRLPKHLTWLLWLLLPPLSFTTLLLTYLWNGAFDDPGLINPSPLVSAFYVAIHRTIWTALVAWLVFACSTGRAKLLSQLLSHPIFIPISRLSYSIYLVHLPVIMFRALNIRHTIEWTDQNFLWEACGNFVISIFMGYFLNIAFESPIINLENYISGRDRPMAACAKGAQLQQQRQLFDISASMSNNKNLQEMNSKAAGLGYLNAASEGSASCHESEDQSSSPEQARKSQPNSATTSTADVPDSSSSTLDAERQKQEAPTLGVANGSTRETLLSAKRRLSNACDNGDDDGHHSPQQSIVNDESVHSYRRGYLSQRQHQRRMSQSELIPSGRAVSDKMTKTSSLIGDQERDRGAMMTDVGMDNLSASRKVGHSNRGDRLALASSQQFSGRKQLYPFTSANEDDLYNISGEYRHYAPAGYQQWRMYNQGSGTMSGNSRGRPMQYATLARTSQFTHHDHHRPLMLLDYHHRHFQQQHHNRHRSPLGPSRQLQQSSYRDHHNYPLDSVASTATVAGHQSRASFRQLSDYRMTHDLADLGDLDRHDHVDADIRHEELGILRRHRQGRYNTLTGTGSRDFRSQYSYPASDVGVTSELGGTTWHQQTDWAQPSGKDGGSLVSTSGGVGARSHQGALSAASWLQQGAMIPRVDSSTLRRQARWQADQTATSSIVEEMVEQDNDDHKDGAGDQTSAL